ncbi:hypothetical protein KIPB_008419, partial [Kipferlia bialata]
AKAEEEVADRDDVRSQLTGVSGRLLAQLLSRTGTGLGGDARDGGPSGAWLVVGTECFNSDVVAIDYVRHTVTDRRRAPSTAGARTAHTTSVSRECSVLLVLTADRHLYGYDITNMKPGTGAALSKRLFMVRAEETANPTALCVLPSPGAYHSADNPAPITDSDEEMDDDEAIERLMADAHGRGERLPISKAVAKHRQAKAKMSTEAVKAIKAAEASLLSESEGMLCFDRRPDLQPVDMRSRLVIANDEYKLRIRDTNALPARIEVNLRTVTTQAAKQRGRAVTAPSGGMRFNIDADNSGPLPLRRTVLGPTFGQPLSALRPVQGEFTNQEVDLASVSVGGEDGGRVSVTSAMADRRPYSAMSDEGRALASKHRTPYEAVDGPCLLRHKCQYVAYSTPHKVIGLMRTPLDGSPHKSIAMIAHGGPISHFETAYTSVSTQTLIDSHIARPDTPVHSFATTYLLSAGGSDGTINTWRVQYPAFDAAVDIAQTPLLDRLEGGEGGPFHQEILDYFTYACLETQGMLDPGLKKPQQRCPIGALGNVLAALGVYLSKEELLNAQNEVVEEQIRRERLVFSLKRAQAATLQRIPLSRMPK